jgi:hypothetical protein
MSKKYDPTITLFPRVFTSKSGEHSKPYYRKVISVLELIKTGRWAKEIAAIRSVATKKERNNLKLFTLPVLLIHGTFTGKEAKDLVAPSGLMALDFDILGSKITDVERRLRKDPHVFTIFTSPSGDGLKVLYRVEDITTDEVFKQCFKQVRFLYPELDRSGCNINRACFVSHDPDLYINPEAEVFKMNPDLVEVKNTARTREVLVPLEDDEDKIERLTPWINKTWDSSLRNTSAFIVAAAFNKFGVSQAAAEAYLLRYEESDFPASEIIATTKSAYTRLKAEFNTLALENRKGLKQTIKSSLRSGASTRQIADTTGVPSTKIEKIKNEFEPFWTVSQKGGIIINNIKFRDYLESLGFRKITDPIDSKKIVFVELDGFIAEVTTVYKMKDSVTADLEAKEEYTVLDHLLGNQKYFKEDYLSFMQDVLIEKRRDAAHDSTLFYRNGFLTITKKGKTFRGYDKLDYYIYRDIILDRDYIEVTTPSVYEGFIGVITKGDPHRGKSVQSVIGYLLHAYRDDITTQTVILSDEEITDDGRPQGGTGKGLFRNALRHFRNIEVLNGKAFSIEDQFRYANVEPSVTDIISIDDASIKLDLMNLFSEITEGITVRRLHKAGIKIPAHLTPKLLIDTNHVIKTDGESYRRRIIEVEFAGFFNAQNTPNKHFGHTFFKDWDTEEWGRFDNFMTDCIRLYLTQGLVRAEAVNLEYKKLVAATNPDFVDWCEYEMAHMWGDNTEIDYRYLYQKLISETPELANFGQRTFNAWLKRYFEYYGFKVDYKRFKTNGSGRCYFIHSITPGGANV